jgi:hypothetical protein
VGDNPITHLTWVWEIGNAKSFVQPVVLRGVWEMVGGLAPDFKESGAFVLGRYFC